MKPGSKRGGTTYGAAWGLSGLALVGGLGIACAAPLDSAPARPAVRIASAFAPLSNRLIEDYRRTLPWLEIQAQRSADALAAIDDGTADLGIATADRVYAAYWKQGSPAESRLRGIALLHPLSAYVLVRPGSNIRVIEDLTGRVVVLGPRNTSSWTLGTLAIEAAGARPALVRSVTSREEAASALENGSADAIFFPGYTYPDEATYATIRRGAYLIPIEGPAVERLRRAHPFVRATTIPRNIYPGQDRVIPTIGLDTVVVGRRDLDESVVHALTEALFDALPRLVGVEASLRFLDVERAPATPIPLHSGASRYFRERGLSR